MNNTTFETKYNVAMFVLIIIASCVTYWLPYWGVTSVLGSMPSFAISCYCCAVMAGVYAKWMIEVHQLDGNTTGLDAFELATLSAEVGDRVDGLFHVDFWRILQIAVLAFVPFLGDLAANYLRQKWGMYYVGYNTRFAILSIFFTGALGYLACLIQFNAFSRK